MSKFLAKLRKAKIATAAALINADNQGKPKLPPFIPGTAAYATSTIEISISCRNLEDRDLMSKSDPMVVVYTWPPGAKSWVQVLRTEVVYDDLNPDFATKVIMPYHFERIQRLRFEVYDVDFADTELATHDKLGFVETSLGQIVLAGEKGLELELGTFKGFLMPLQKDDAPKEPQKIILTAEELSSEKDEVTLRLCGENCGKWSGILPPKTFFTISKANNAGRYSVVFRSKHSYGSKPHWPKMEVSARAMCNGDYDRELKIEAWQWMWQGKVKNLGYTRTTLNKLLKTTNQESLVLMMPNGEVTTCFLRVLECGLQPINTFIDYLQAGTQIQCNFAIDFTCSNGDPEDSVSLHHISRTSHCPNPYEQAIQAVGNILKDYDSTNLFPAYGFGARIPPKGDVSHNFPLTLSKSPNCDSIFGVLEAYRNCVSKIVFYAPTNFAPIINAVADVASKSKGGKVYHILVIVTDGVITDLQKTKKAIVEASNYPMSIIIIGVGEADFSAMEELDSDAVPLKYKRKEAKRDIVQFVAYRSWRTWMANTGEVTVDSLVNDLADLEEIAKDAEAAAKAPAKGPTKRPGSPTDDIVLTLPEETVPIKPVNLFYQDTQEQKKRLAQSHLASEVLAEIPEQIVGYMKMKGILPTDIERDVPAAEPVAELPPEIVEQVWSGLSGSSVSVV